MTHRSRRSLAATGLLSLTLAAAGSLTAGAAPHGNADGNANGSSVGNNASDAASTVPGQDRSSAIVRLSGDPLATDADVDRDADGDIVLDVRATRNVRADLAAERNAFKAVLRDIAPKARITSVYDITLNAVAVELNGTSLETLRSAPGVAAVEYQQLYHAASLDDPDLERINTFAGWESAGATSVDSDPSTWAGYGTKVGILDTGIDADHPCFDDTGFPETEQLGDTSLTNNKVIVAKVFSNKTKQRGYTAEDLGGHGSHVAGTVACNLQTPAVVDGAPIGYDPSGVAPGAQLGSYVVLPGTDDFGRSEDIMNGIEAAVADGMDVLNMSLGGGYSGKQDLLTMAVDNADRAGVVVAVAAGNDGPGYQTTGSPGVAERALTAGASTVGHFVGVPVSAAGSQVSVAALGEFPVPETDLTAPLGLVRNGEALGEACSGVAEDLTGQIALLSRGTCSFSQKVAYAEAAGAVAVLVVNNVPGDPMAMALTDSFPTTIPAVQVGLADREALMALAGTPVTIGADRAYTRTGNDDILASFSSWGPTRVSMTIKPDVVAPGAGVLSAQPLHFCEGAPWVGEEGCWAFYQGTSMATPHLAGMAAVVRAAHPDWDAWQVRSAIANTATVDGVFKTAQITVPETDVQKVGNGLADLDAALGAEVAFDRTTLSFGATPAGSATAVTREVTIANLTDEGQQFPVSVAGDGIFSVDRDFVYIHGGGTATVRVTFAPARGELAGPHQAHLIVGDSHLALYAYVQ